MRLLERNKVDVLLAAAAPRATAYVADERPTYLTPAEARAVVQPAGGHTSAQLYGERVSRMLTMLYDGPIPLAEGMGVCVSANAISTGVPDYRIVAPPEQWSGHQRATLEGVQA